MSKYIRVSFDRTTILRIDDVKLSSQSSGLKKCFGPIHIRIFFRPIFVVKVDIYCTDIIHLEYIDWADLYNILPENIDDIEHHEADEDDEGEYDLDGDLTEEEEGEYISESET